MGTKRIFVTLKHPFIESCTCEKYIYIYIDLSMFIIDHYYLEKNILTMIVTMVTNITHVIMLQYQKVHLCVFLATTVPQCTNRCTAYTAVIKMLPFKYINT